MPVDVEFILTTVPQIGSNEQRVLYKDTAGYEQMMNYDILILAIGSIVCEPVPIQGGIALQDLDVVRKFRSVVAKHLLH